MAIHAGERTQLHAVVVVHLCTEGGRYLRACAKIRDVSLTRLMQLLVNKIGEDQLTEAVLDDNGQHSRGKREHHFKEQHGE